MTDAAKLTPADVEQIRERGVAIEEIERQIALLRAPRHFVRLERACSVGDGIVRIADEEARGLLEAHAAAAGQGRFCKFVPASGAATRMFRDLSVFRAAPRSAEAFDEIRRSARAGDRPALALETFLAELERFPFADALRARMADDGAELADCAAAGRFRPILDALLGDGGLGYADLPKALLPFHRYPSETRTAFEEHLVEATGYVRDDGCVARLHFTVSPEHRSAFDRLFRQVREPYRRRFDTEFEIGYSTQKPSTDTVAIERPGGALLRDETGRLVFRPAGHGALIENLSELDADLVYIKNIDNVQPDRVKPLANRYKQMLGGFLVRLRRRTGRVLEELRRGVGGLEDAARFAARRLHVDLNGRLDRSGSAAGRAWLIDRLRRPIRVCGVVRNTGEPGGGPFWTSDVAGRRSLQLVEAAQVDPDDGGQRAIFAAATHFSPVDLVCALRDADGRPYDLGRFVDRDAVIVTTKTAKGRSLRALERPGLWNGAMAGWNTVFVEVPLETFTPVKTVFDLLRPEHRAGE
ncbi:MAG TPA: DUF4301 family protein [Candidatus Polarisedimenticolaceae bacterium]|nr:DUF4301 family protein [Candidatus Polarisedimenticolaceae bacterium]